MVLQVNILKNCVRQVEMDQMECARDYMFWIFDHFLISPSIHTYIQYIKSAAVGVRTCPAEGLSDPVPHLSWLWALFSQL
jgi:hypothetical protein